IAPDVFAVWMRLLSAVDKSVLWLSSLNLSATRRLRDAAAAHGIAAERLVFAPFVAAPEDHLARLGLADLFLDTLPCNPHRPGMDALVAGVPVLTARGRSFAGRVAASLLGAAGLTGMIVDSLSDYEALALRLAREPDALGAVRAKLAQ